MTTHTHPGFRSRREALLMLLPVAVLAMAGMTVPRSLGAAAADVAEGQPASPPGDSQPEPTPAELDAEFKQLVTNVKLVGNFTIDGQRPGDLQREEYVITGAMKLGAGDLWALTSRIKYGDVDLTVPVPVRVKWAGRTPVITVDAVTIPGLGTFSARVLLDKTRYAGTWSHDDKGGHLFGSIEPQPATEQ